jgi:hypothetical protein
VILAFSATAVIFAAGSTYDSSADPLVSLSFLTEIFKPELQDEIDRATDDIELSLQAQIDSLRGQVASLANQNALLKDRVAELENEESTNVPEAPVEVVPSDVRVYTVAVLKKGDVLVAEEACELILRAGEAIAMTPSVSRTLIDCTDGVELISGSAIPANHFVLIPESANGSGITVTSNTASVMVKGEYSIVKK